MAQLLAPTGTSAQIITLPTAALRPVIQTRIRGRLPKTVLNLRTIKRDRCAAADVASAWRLKEINQMKDQIQFNEHLLFLARQNLDNFIQSPEKGYVSCVHF